MTGESFLTYTRLFVDYDMLIQLIDAMLVQFIH